MDVKKIAVEEMNRCIVEATKACANRPPQPIITFDLKGRLFGRAWGHRLIEINQQIAQAVGEAKLRNTVAHEYAHILTNWLIKNIPNSPLLLGDLRGGHGKGWKNVMKFLGLDPVRCAPAEEVAKAAKAGALGNTFRYVCECGFEYYASKRFHNSRGGQTTHRCGKTMRYKPE